MLKSGQSLVVRGAVPAKRTRFPIPLSGSGGKEPPPPSLAEPYVTVSCHTAPTSRLLVIPDRSVPVRRLRCQALICRPFAFTALVLMAGEKLTKWSFVRPRARRPRKV